MALAALGVCAQSSRCFASTPRGGTPQGRRLLHHARPESDRFVNQWRFGGVSEGLGGLCVGTHTASIPGPALFAEGKNSADGRVGASSWSRTPRHPRTCRGRSQPLSSCPGRRSPPGGQWRAARLSSCNQQQHSGLQVRALCRSRQRWAARAVASRRGQGLLLAGARSGQSLLLLLGEDRWDQRGQTARLLEEPASANRPPGTRLLSHSVLPPTQHRVRSMELAPRQRPAGG